MLSSDRVIMLVRLGSMDTFQLRISNAEHAARCNSLLENIKAAGCSGVVLFDRDYVIYYAGFAFIPTERPIAFLMNSKGERGLFVPRMEVEHARSNALIDSIAHYPEYPDDPHPMSVLGKLLTDMGITGKVAADGLGYPHIFGYRGPDLAELPLADPITVYPIRSSVEDQMMCKSPAELTLLQESCRWGNLALRLLQRYTAPGLTETEVEKRASDEATRAMVDAIGPIYRGLSMVTGGAYGIYRGQIGRSASMPHMLANNITFQVGDVLVGESTAPVWGYISELERTMFLGQPSDQHKRFFDHMLALQEVAFSAFETARYCCDIDHAVRAYFAKHDLTQYWRHHTGHAIGLRYHEGPFLDRGDKTELRPGMVFTIEPGIYVPELGGFRHSDMVVVKEGGGAEQMTFYPRDLDSMIIPA
ncbi:MAG: aminopeptidase P family protein [Anaerolineae bacterium]|nr:aminopeptidase P family protein [Anaerolineae bacterium]